MIDRFLWWLAQRPFSDRPRFEDVYVWASIRRYERTRKARHPKLTGLVSQPLQRKEVNRPTH